MVALLVVAGCGGDDGGSAASDITVAEVTVTTIAAGADFDGVVPVAGHDVHLLCQGEGAPTVMIEMGAGQSVSAWNGTQPVLAESQRTCVYERAGTGDSEPGEEPRTAQAIADELHELIVTAGLETPIVLLSHSLGGLDAQAFAQQYPDDVAGLVFVEPRTAAYQLGYRDNLTEDELAIDDRDIEDMVANAPFGAEVAVADDSAAAVVEAGDLPDVPVIVLSAGVGFPDQSEVDRAFWLQTHEDLAAQVADGTVIVVDGAEHEIWRSHQEAVVDAVAEVVAAAGG
jgi:pimeloyl-ACP methyl ester carboxylesterase